MYWRMKVTFLPWNAIPWDVAVRKGVFASIPSWSPSCLRLLCLELYLKAEQTQDLGRGRYMMETINNRYPSPCSAFQGMLSVPPVDDRCSVPLWAHSARFTSALVCWRPPGALGKSGTESLQHPYVHVLLSACWSYICSAKKKIDHYENKSW